MIGLLYEHLDECVAMGRRVVKMSGSVNLGWTVISGAKDVAFTAFHEGKITQDDLAKFIEYSNKGLVSLVS